MASATTRSLRLLRLLPAEFLPPLGGHAGKPAMSTIMCRNYSLAQPLVQPAIAVEVGRTPEEELLPNGTFRSDDLQVTLSPPFKLQPKPDVGNLIFGRTFTDHMFSVEWDKAAGWTKPKIRPMENLQIHPAAKVLHYAIEVS